jgi:cytochrome c oxidase accessory protein FixG
MYQKEAKVYPREVSGTFARLRKVAMFVLLALFYGVAWLNWEGHQAVLFDLPARKFYIFGLTFWPQDFIYLSVTLIIAGLSLFFFTALAGRLWCGYACPQTVWTEVFLMIEERIEGRRNKRIKLDQGPWTQEKILRKSVKQLLWVAIALWTGFTFVGYFTPIVELGYEVMNLTTGPWETFWVLFYGFATYGNAGILREQVCKYMCPYARFQAAMFDQDTLIISYDQGRGEPRGARRQDTDLKHKGLGECIDCKLCVQVCPTGIDIRQGLQIECIACAACIDVCDEVMDKMAYPRGLIRYTSEHALAGKSIRILRPRIFVYATLLLVIIAGLVVSIANRTPLRMDVLRDRNALYRVVAPGVVENVYTLKVINMQDTDHRYRLEVTGIQGLYLDSKDQIEVAAGVSDAFTMRLRAAEDTGSGPQRINVSIESLDDNKVRFERQSRFFLPGTPSN